MTKLKNACWTGAVAAALLAAVTASRLVAAENLQQFEYTQPKMGTEFRLLIWAKDQKTADEAAEAAWDRINQLSKELSDYDPESELNRLCRQTDAGPMTEAVPVSDDLWAMLERGIAAAEISDGAFDITIGPLSRLQREERKTGKLPDPQRFKDAKDAVGWKYIKLDREHHRVQLLHARMQLDLGGIAKGFTSDQVVKLFRQRGITRALCGAAGDIAAGDAPPGRSDWRIAIQSLKSPEQNSEYVGIHNYGISTSGDTYRAAVVDGKEYSHIIDPHTGQGLSNRIGATTIAPEGATTDWTGTAISILGPEKGIEMIERIPGAAARVITIDEKGIEKVYESKRLKQFLVPHDLTSTPPTQGVK